MPSEVIARAEQLDQWLREGNNGDVADVLRDLVAECRRLQCEMRHYHMRADGAFETIKAEKGRAEAAEASLVRLRAQVQEAFKFAHARGGWPEGDAWEALVGETGDGKTNG